MSEFDSRPGDTAPGSPNSAAPSAGVQLRRAREAAGLHIAALAVSLKVPVKKLEALEGDRLDLLPDAVFVRALAASVCRTLKIDPGPVLMQLPQTGKPRLTHQQPSINAPFRAPGDAPGPSVWSKLSPMAIMAAALVVLATGAFIFLPSAQQQGTPAQASSESSAGTSASTSQAGVAMAKTELVEPAPAVQPLAAQPAPPPAVAAVPAAASTSPMPAVSASAVNPVAAQAPSTPAPAPATASETAQPALAPAGIIVFRASGQSWVEVTDAKGVVVLRRMLAAGEAAGASGALPLSAVVGKVDVTTVQVRGQAFNLAPVSRDNVARFEVK